MPRVSKTMNNRHDRQLSQKPAAVKLREIRRNRNSDERLFEKINSQRRSAIRRARIILDRTAWSILSVIERKTVWNTVENLLRSTYNIAARAGDDTLSTAAEVQKVVVKAFEAHAHLFVPSGEDEPLPCELFEYH